MVAKVPPGEGKRYAIRPQAPTDRTLWKGEAVTIIVKASSFNSLEDKSVVSARFSLVVYQKVATPDPVLVGSTFWITLFGAASAAVLAGTGRRGRRR